MKMIVKNWETRGNKHTQCLHKRILCRWQNVLRCLRYSEWKKKAEFKLYCFDPGYENLNAIDGRKEAKQVEC